jgi:hypothetical protein
MKITILFFSSNRLEFLIPSMDSFFKHINFDNFELYSILIDDYPKDRDDELFKNIQKKYGIDKLILHDENKGYSKTWKEGWDNIPKDTDYIFHQEDDFTYHTEIEISSLIQILKKQPKLYQIVLKRQIWYEPPTSDLIYKLENGQLKTFEESFNIDGKTHYITGNRKLFNANPCIYPYFITQLEYGNTVQEHMILSHLLKKHPDMYGCFYGKRLDSPLTTHIGHFTQGKKVLPGEPGYERYKVYDPNKKYDAKKWLTKYIDNKETIQTYILKLKNILQIKESNDKIKQLKKLIETSDDFLEGYYYLMLEYQHQKEYLKAYTTGVSAGQKWRNTKFFINDEQQFIYEYLFDLSFALNAYYSEFYDEAFIINKKILNKFPNHKNIQGNQVFYNEKFNKYILENTTNLSDHFTLNKPKITVIDDFYKNPDKIRDFALKQKFNIGGNFPGKRTTGFKEQYHKEMFEKILGKKIKYWPDQYNGCFQIVTENLKSWIHRDLTEYSAIIFLNPKPKISSGGTNLYVHKKTGLFKAKNKEEEKLLSNDTRNLDTWEITDTLGNLYNRCIIFQGKNNHKSNEYFGNSLYNGRLFQIFFFDT